MADLAVVNSTLMHPYFEKLDELSPALRRALFRPPARARDLAVLAKLCAGTPLAALHACHAGSAAPVLFLGADFPMHRLLAPAEIVARCEAGGAGASSDPGALVPFALAESGGYEEVLAIRREGPDAGRIVSVDSEGSAPRPVAESLEALLAAELDRIERGEIVGVGFENRDPPQLLGRHELDAMSEVEGAYRLPRAPRRRERPPQPQAADEGLRFLATLAERRLIEIAPEGELGDLAVDVARTLRRRVDAHERAVAVHERLARESVVRLLGSPRAIGLILERW